MQGIVTSFPENVFRAGLTDKFCAERDKKPDAALEWTVDSKGNLIPAPSKRLRRRRGLVGVETHNIDARSPPPNPDAYNEYSVKLSWRPQPPFMGCHLTCHDTMMKIANSPCKLWLQNFLRLDQI
jgi:hypothetical protein